MTNTPHGVEVQITGLCKTFVRASAHVEVLRGLDLHIDAGERVAVLGPSGSGKSTLMYLLGLLDVPSAGRISLDGRDVGSMREREREAMRARRIGFVFQSHNLLSEHDALGNVMMPVLLAGGSQAVARARARALLDAVGLSHRLSHKPSALSGGEQQRVAIARALVMAPGLVLADEPTGNLDVDSADHVFSLLLDLQMQLGSTLVVVTHSHELAARFPRRLVMRDGTTVEA